MTNETEREREREGGRDGLREAETDRDAVPMGER